MYLSACVWRGLLKLITYENQEIGNVEKVFYDPFDARTHFEGLYFERSTWLGAFMSYNTIVQFTIVLPIRRQLILITNMKLFLSLSCQWHGHNVLEQFARSLISDYSFLIRMYQNISGNWLIALENHFSKSLFELCDITKFIDNENVYKTIN